ncbi:heme-binding domain-containing protein [Zhouia sp. PK063]|uniref:heme-binding domain-containing protein n=1 Tax=Zhouia sp. PK063 TaxID=3373602 RepID=UPI00379E35C7
MKIVKIILVALLVILVLMQFYRPEKNIETTPTEANLFKQTDVPQDVAQMLKTSCFDCHSNNTEYPWYNNIAPVSYWLADHINGGKRHLNFSEWGNYSTKKKLHKLDETKELVEKKHMPIDSYLWIHKDAKLSEEQIQKISAWVDSYSASLQATAAQQ